MHACANSDSPVNLDADADKTHEFSVYDAGRQWRCDCAHIDEWLYLPSCTSVVAGRGQGASTLVERLVTHVWTPAVLKSNLEFDATVVAASNSPIAVVAAAEEADDDGERVYCSSSAMRAIGAHELGDCERVDCELGHCEQCDDCGERRARQIARGVAWIDVVDSPAERKRAFERLRSLCHEWRDNVDKQLGSVHRLVAVDLYGMLSESEERILQDLALLSNSCNVTLVVASIVELSERTRQLMHFECERRIVNDLHSGFGSSSSVADGGEPSVPFHFRVAETPRFSVDLLSRRLRALGCPASHAERATSSERASSWSAWYRWLVSGWRSATINAGTDSQREQERRALGRPREEPEEPLEEREEPEEPLEEPGERETDQEQDRWAWDELWSWLLDLMYAGDAGENAQPAFVKCEDAYGDVSDELGDIH